MKEGSLPNIEKLMEGGVYTEALSCPPCDTPTNWTTIATGATTGVHGVTSFYTHIPGEPLDLGVQYRSRTQLSRYCMAEYLWDVADRHGLKPFVLNYPSGWPGNLKHGAMSLLVWPIPESLPRIISSPQIQTFQLDSKNSKLKISQSKEKLKKDVSYSTPLRIILEIDDAPIKKALDYKIYIIDTEGNGYDCLYIPSINDNEEQFIKESESSDWISIQIDTDHGNLPCLFKIKAMNIPKDGNGVKIQRSAIFNTKGWTKPESLGEKIIKNVPVHGPPEEHEVEYFISGKVEPYLLFAREEATSIAETIKFTRNYLGWKTCFFHVHFLDTVNHKTLAFLHEDSPLFTEESMETANNNAKTAYMIVDELVEKVMKSVDKDTLVVFVSDHGAIPTWKNVNINNALIEADLLKYKWNDGRKRFLIDWKKSKVFPYFEPPYIWVNKIGRDPQGIVSESEYEKVRDDILNALRNFKDPETGESLIKLAIRKEEKTSLGQDGERVGDIVYFLKPPYQIFDGNTAQLNAAVKTRRMMKKPNVSYAKGMFGAHAYYLPTEKFGDFSISVPLIFNGPGVKEGFKLQEQVNLIDLAPTLAQLLDIPKPANAQGRVLDQVFD